MNDVDTGKILVATGVLSKEQLDAASALAEDENIPLDRAVERLGLIRADDAETLYLEAVKLADIDKVLLELGFISAEELNKAKADLKDSAIPLERHLLKTGALTESQYAMVLARRYEMEYVDLDSFEVNEELFRRFEVSVMRRYNFIPYSLQGRELVAIAADPTDISIFDELEALLDLNIKVKLSAASEIKRLINFMVETSLDETVLFGDALPQTPATLETIEEGEGQAEIDVADQERQAMQSSIVGLVDSVLLQAVRKQASDIHFEIHNDEFKIRYRIDGVLFDVASFATTFHSPAVSRIKIIAKLDIAEKRVPQDGRFRVLIDDRNVDFRVSVLPSVNGETVVLRILDKTALGLDIEKLGFEAHDLKVFKQAANQPYGMLLVAGPTGSGKTTTLYSAIMAVLTDEKKFITIEDPIEYQLPGVVQIAVNEKKGLTFANGLRAIVRQDPDKLLIGEIRDEETASIAVNAALTGHLVLSTIHANNVMDAVGRLIGMGIDPYEFVSSFNLIMSQRLVRSICDNCKKPMDDLPASLVELIPDFETAANSIKTFYHGTGCRFCHKTGYSGREGIFEIMRMSDRIKQMILNRASPLATREVAVEEGMTPLRKACWKKVAEGKTTLMELNRVTLV